MARPGAYRIEPVGRLGNQMLQYLLAMRIRREVPGLEVSGYHLPEWGLVDDDATVVPPSAPLLRGHVVPHALVRLLLRAGVPLRAVTPGCRMENLPGVDACRGVFRPADPVVVPGFGPEHLVVSVRAAEVLAGKHPDYFPTPVGLVVDVVEATGLEPVFVGQVADDPYTGALRARFPGAEFLPSGGPIVDFESLRSAHHVLPAPSTFSWLAAWLSNAAVVHQPVAAQFHPRQRPDIDLLPVHDPRYRFYEVAPRRYTGSPDDLRFVLESTGRPLGAAALERLRRRAAPRVVAWRARNAALLSGRTLRYASAWRRRGDHHPPPA